ncbi:uncharacterized protein LOC108466417 [Gossypium arboreum]|uniref:uncharacterized protein LOC108466417 n=1 Tax=Gossypium arboreum TaxID=29729 RepID=UPI000819535D|nr:uncharacterized protein LOC108466417 [Gossypium arboreum]
MTVCEHCGRRHYVVVAATPAPAWERGHGRGNGGKGVGQHEATQSVRESGILVETSRLGVMVKSPLGDSVVVDQVYCRCPLIVQGQVFPVDLLELLFWGFDVILRMDWLTKHQMKVDCELKMVTLCCTYDSEVVVVGEKFEFFSNVISSLRVEKLVQKGCEAYLAYVLNVDGKELRLDEIRAICDFTDVFRKELPSLPPDREVEFGIELYPGSSGVNCALSHDT